MERGAYYFFSFSYDAKKGQLVDTLTSTFCRYGLGVGLDTVVVRGDLLADLSFVIWSDWACSGGYAFLLFWFVVNCWG